MPIGFPSDIDEGIIKSRTDVWPHYNADAIIKNNRLQNPISVSSGWSSKDLFQEFIDNNCLPIRDSKGQKTIFTISTSGAIEIIKTRSSEQSHVITTLNNLGGPQKATSEIAKLEIVFDDYPKSTELIKYFLILHHINPLNI